MSFCLYLAAHSLAFHVGFILSDMILQVLVLTANIHDMSLQVVIAILCVYVCTTLDTEG